MPTKRKPRVPSLRCHKATGQGYVELSGRRFYCGVFGRRETRRRYDQLLAEWLANGRQRPVPANDIRVIELIARFMAHAAAYYRRPDGTPTSEGDNYRQALRPLRELYGSTPATDFTPLALRAVRERMIANGWCRTWVNQSISRIKMVFRWGTEHGLVSPSVHHGLLAVSGLRAGRCEARESEPVRPVPEAHVDAILDHLPGPVRAMIELQRLTGMRPGEVCVMRACDIDTAGKVWQYRPPQHKTSRFDHQRVIDLGPKAQQLIRPFLKPDLRAHLFSPAEAEAERHTAQRQARKTLVQPSQVKRAERSRRRRRQRPPGESYDVAAYRRAIARACKATGTPSWHPHQLRHSFATWVRKQYGLEVARAALGHRSLGIADTYAELDRGLALKVAAEVG